jgi:hypothetical protein
MEPTRFSPSPPQQFERPPCPECGTRMQLTRIKPDEPDYDHPTFECPRCWHSTARVFKFN